MIYKRIKSIFILIGALMNLGLYGQLLNIDSCLNVLKTAKEDTNKVLLLDAIAWDISYSNLQTGIDYSLQAYELAKKLNYERVYPRLFNTQAAIYTDMGDISKSIDLCLEGLYYAKKTNQPKLQIFLFNSLGNIFAKRRDYQKALEYYIQSNETAKKYLNKINSSAVGNIASTLIHFGKLDSAMYYAKVVLDYNVKKNNIDKLANNYLLLSEIYYELKDGVKATQSALKSVEAAKNIKDEYTLAHCYIQLCNGYYALKDYKKSKEVLDTGKIYAEKLGDIIALKTIARYYSEIYEEMGDFKNSLKFYKEYKMYEDSIFKTENLKQEKNAEAKYENDKKQKEIELLASQQKQNELENEKKKLYLYSSLAGLFILVLVSVVLYRNNILKQRTNKNLESLNKEIHQQKELVEFKNKEITDSINYAKRIQQSILTSDAYFKKHTKDFFILFKPKDIVSGDFYWALNHNQKLLVMTADCTGHGVPGAMMSMMGVNFLNEIVNEKKIESPASILNQLRHDIIKALNPEGSVEISKDGMDCCLCSFDYQQMKLTYAAANNNFYIIRDGKIITSEADKMPVGAGHGNTQPFNEYTFDLKTNDLIITLTDGYADQFGGDKGKKFKYKRFEDLILESAHLPLNELKIKLDTAIESWRGDLEQLDDICVIGVKV